MTELEARRLKPGNQVYGRFSDGVSVVERTAGDVVLFIFDNVIRWSAHVSRLDDMDLVLVLPAREALR